MATTPQLDIEYLDEGQRQKEAAINDAFTTIDTNIFRDIGEYTVAGLPSAAANTYALAIATNASGGRTLVRSNGSAWKVISVEGGTVTT